MNKVLMTLIFLLILLMGCQDNHVSKDTWGSKQNISMEDISEIEIQKKEDSDVILPEQEINSFMNAINRGVYDAGKLDIGPSDYTVEINLKSGNTKELSIWVAEGGNLFTDHDESGHYKLGLSELTQIREILDEVYPQNK